MRKLLAILLVSVLASTVSAEVLLYDDCSTVSAEWAQTDITLTSDGDFLRVQNSASGYAIRPFGTTAGEFTMVFDMKITDPGDFVGLHTYSVGGTGWPSEGTDVNHDFTAQRSWDHAALKEITPDEWYTVAIYGNGASGYMAYWIEDGKGADVWNGTRLAEWGTSPYSARNAFILYAYASTLYGDCDMLLDDIQINSGLDFAQGPEPVLLEGDANRDGVVSAGDYASVQSNFGNTGEAGLLGDANLDGVVSAGDYASVQANFGNVAAAIVPEPASMCLLSLGGLVALIRRRK